MLFLCDNVLFCVYKLPADKTLVSANWCEIVNRARSCRCSSAPGAWSRLQVANYCHWTFSLLIDIWNKSKHHLIYEKPSVIFTNEHFFSARTFVLTQQFALQCLWCDIGLFLSLQAFQNNKLNYFFRIALVKINWNQTSFDLCWSSESES